MKDYDNISNFTANGFAYYFITLLLWIYLIYYIYCLCMICCMLLGDSRLLPMLIYASIFFISSYSIFGNIASLALIFVVSLLLVSSIVYKGYPFPDTKLVAKAFCYSFILNCIDVYDLGLSCPLFYLGEEGVVDATLRA